MNEVLKNSKNEEITTKTKFHKKSTKIFFFEILNQNFTLKMVRFFKIRITLQLKSYLTRKRYLEKPLTQHGKIFGRLKIQMFALNV